MTTNDAAERRLRTIEAMLWDESDGKGNHVNYDERVAFIKDALAAERRATVERIRAALATTGPIYPEDVAHVLDAEAER